MKQFNAFVIFLLALFTMDAASHATDLLKIDRQIDRIIIDPGLGGGDKGVESCIEGVFAKDINPSLEIVGKNIRKGWFYCLK